MRRPPCAIERHAVLRAPCFAFRDVVMSGARARPHPVVFPLQRAGIWSGLIAIFLFFLGFALSGFIPPASPTWSAEAVAAHYREHAIGIRSGMALMMISAMFVPPLIAVISYQMRRIAGASPLLAYAQLSAGTMNAMFFIIPPLLFLATAYRPERSIEITWTLHETAWIMAVMPWSPAFMQNIVIAVAILIDKSPRPVFPRWLAYMNIWVAIGFIPGGLLPFFHSGPFAWSGIFVFWLAGSVFVAWFLLMIWMLFRAVASEQREAQEQPA